MATEKQKVLVVDDSWVVLGAVRAALGAAGYLVRTAENEADATSHVPWAQLAIVDFHMPVMDGATLLPRLKKAVPVGGKCAFYLYTSDVDVARKYAEFGFDGGFLKKGDEKALLPQVEAAFRTIQLRELAETLRSSRRSSPPKGHRS